MLQSSEALRENTEEEFYIENMISEEFCDACEITKRTLSRKIKQGFIHPKIIKSKQGTKEYRFDTTDVKAFYYDKKMV